jgi:hypothetical protein
MHYARGAVARVAFDAQETAGGRCLTRTLQLTRPSVAALPQDLAAERQSLGRHQISSALNANGAEQRALEGGPPGTIGQSTNPPVQVEGAGSDRGTALVATEHHR